MMLLERLIGLIAPYECLNCGHESALLCDRCATELARIPSRCYSCYRNTSQSRTCRQCRARSSLFQIWAATTYDGVAKQLIHRLKYERAQAAALDVARTIAQRLPHDASFQVITYVPTVTSHVRLRGYDQARQIARALGRELHIPVVPLLARMGQRRQVGQSGQLRRQQLHDAFRPLKPLLIKDARILLVDDVLTTGATLEAAAATLKVAGARRISAAVFAQA